MPTSKQLIKRSMAVVLDTPLDVWLSIFRYLSITDILNIRQARRTCTIVLVILREIIFFFFQTCKDMHEITNLRSVWNLLLDIHFLQQNIPIPGLHRQPIDSLSGSELEELTLRALRLRRNWSSPSPIASTKYSLRCDVLPTRLGVVDVQFLPRKPGYLLSLACASNVAQSFSLQCWNLEATPPVCVAMRTVQRCGWFVVNSDESASENDLLAIQSPKCVSKPIE